VQTLTEAPLKSDIYRNSRKPIPVVFARCVSMDIYVELGHSNWLHHPKYNDTSEQWGTLGVVQSHWSDS
jgi:hypothetical protein